MKSELVVESDLNRKVDVQAKQKTRVSAPPMAGPSSGGARFGMSWRPDRRRTNSAPRLSRGAVALGLALVLFIFWQIGGSRESTEMVLVDMGFDPGRAGFLAALLIGAGIAIEGTLILQPRDGALLGALAVSIASLPVLAQSIGTAAGGDGTGASLDPIGLVVTLMTVGVTALIVGWAASTLAWDVRQSLVGLGRSVRGSAVPRPGRWLLRPALAALCCILLLGTLPVLGDMLNYGMDAHLYSGGDNLRIGLVQPGDQQQTAAPSQATPSQATPAAVSGTPSSEPSATGTRQATPSVKVPSGFAAGLVPGPVTDSFVSAGALSDRAPWAAAAPSGTGREAGASVGRFWNGTGAVYISAYLPPGYDQLKGKRYPVAYEVPYSKPGWDKAIHFSQMLDSLITSGQLPPEIIVFVNADNPVYTDSECSNSKDGREWFETWMINQVVPWADSTFRTLATPDARSVFGTSKGGYCAASLVTHHPEVFGSAIVMSGYFVAGLQSSQTQGADLVFGKNAAYERSQSPINRLDGIDRARRARMLIVMEGDPNADVYGAQMKTMSSALASHEIAQAILPSALGHSWDAYRQMLPPALRLVAQRQVEMGVFS